MPKFAVLSSTNGTDLQALIEQKSKLKAQLGLVVVDRECGALKKAKAAGIPHYLLPKFENREERDRLIHAVLKERNMDLVVLIGYMRLISAWFVNEWKNKIMNIHPSLLPAFAGGIDKDVHQEVLDSGCKVTGCTLHFVDEGADTGPIIMQKAVEVVEGETVESLKEKVQKAEQEIILKAVELFSKGNLVIEDGKVRMNGY